MKQRDEAARVYECNCPLVHSLGSDPSCAALLQKGKRSWKKKSEMGEAKSKPWQGQEALSSHGCDKGGNPVSAHQNHPVVWANTR